MSATTATKGLAGDFESAKDAEKGSDVYLLNDAVHTFSWQSISVKVPDRDTKGEKTILCNVSGNVKAGTFHLTIRVPSTRLTLTSRGNDCSYGSFRQW